MNKQKKIDLAKLLIDTKVFMFNKNEPFIYKHKTSSPIYLNYRMLLSYPEAWQLLNQAFINFIDDKNLDFDLIGGVEDNGLAFSASLAYQLKKPYLFVRKANRKSGLNNRIEGEDVGSKKVLLLIDHVSTGRTVAEAIDFLQSIDAEIVAVLAIASFDFIEADVNFAKAGISLFTLTTFPQLIKKIIKNKLLNQQELRLVEGWYKSRQKSTKIKKGN